jgi:drug/metabolite transporter (DMT)-like permease
MKTRWVNLAALVAVNFMWAAQYPAYKVAAERVEVAALNFWTLLVSSLLLLPFWIRERGRGKDSSQPFGWKTVYEYLLLGLLGIIPPSVMLAWGIAHSSSSNAAILSLTIPGLMTLLGMIMLGERLTVIRSLSLGLGLAGTLMISAGDVAQASFSRNLLLGNFVILLGGMGSAFYNTYSKALLARFSELDVLIYSYFVGAAGCAAISIIGETIPFYRVGAYSAATWMAIAVLGVFSWGIAMLLWMWVLNRLDVGQVAMSIYLLPLFGLALSVVTVHDRITAAQILGGAIVVAGTLILTVFEKPQSEAVR